MRAPVYRNIEGRNTFLGLAFPGEALAVLSAFWLLLTSFQPRVALPLGVAIYAAVRLAGRRRAPKYLQHWLIWHFRHRFGAGRLCALARAATPRFPFARYHCRDVPAAPAPPGASTPVGGPVPTGASSPRRPTEGEG